MEATATVYKGLRFRSKLAARWAVFFDELRESFEYERETIQLSADLYCAPDFWLPRQAIWIETQLDVERAVGLHQVTDKSVYIFEGFPDVKRFSDDLGQAEYVAEICNFEIYAVTRNAPNECLSLTGMRLNNTMLYILGMMDQNMSKETFRLRTALLSIAALKGKNSTFDAF